ncbi:MAG: stage V sporulation protein AC [Acutalibacteraceae bacterium]|nr:stage V sporulation protein AC [Acutalibacteraceae bacterium]
MNNQQYQQLVHNLTPKSPLLKDCILAFLFGGSICCFGQLLKTVYTNLNLTEDEVKLAVPVTLIAITAILTGSGLFAKIAKYAGAGTAVPITGFANSVVSPAVEFSAEGKILGTGAKMFNLAGPVIVYGCSAASLYGLIYYLFLK